MHIIFEYKARNQNAVAVVVPSAWKSKNKQKTQIALYVFFYQKLQNNLHSSYFSKSSIVN